MRRLRNQILWNVKLTKHRSIVISYEENSWEELRAIADRFGTDKGGINIIGSSKHAYTDYYSLIFSSRRYEVRHVLECGIGTNDVSVPSNMGSEGTPGASLRMWARYFPTAEIVAFDIDEKSLISEERISTFACNQMDTKKLNSSLRSLQRKFDLIVDDGLHSFDSIVSMFAASFEFLSDFGIYVVEDLDHELAERLIEHFRFMDSLRYHLVRFEESTGRDQGGFLFVLERK